MFRNFQYLERRFCFACRLIASLTFITQVTSFLINALYSLSLDDSLFGRSSVCSSVGTITNFKLAYDRQHFCYSFNFCPLLTYGELFQNCLTYFNFQGGARAGIHTSALQMALIIFSLLIICVASMASWDASMLWKNAEKGLRLDPNE